jgi:hypothetical protein
MMESVKALMDKAPQWMVPDGLVNGVDGVLDEFRRMEDEAVGHSIIPDMVDDIGVVMEGLESKMVDPAKAASDAVNESFKEMSSGIGNSIKGIVQGTTTLKSALRNIGSNALDRFTQRTVYDPLNSMIDGIDFSSMLSFAGGGSTGGGSRSGGVDGQGGFPALLHPNETVIDHTKGQSMGGQTTNVTINISGNVDQRAINQIKQVVASDPSMIHQLNENGRRTGASIGAR